VGKVSQEATTLGPVCEGCGERTDAPTWFDMDPFCSACVSAMEVGDDDG
jgi:hypothetical protein